MKPICSIWAFVILSLSPSLIKAQFLKEGYNRDDIINSNEGLTQVYFVGTGDIQLAAQQGNKIAANTGLGVLFWRIWPNDIELQLDAKINVASTVDTLAVVQKNGIVDGARIFGLSLLAPSTNGQGTAINTLWYLKDVKKGKRGYIDGLQFTALVSNQVWQLRTIILNPATGTDEVTIMARDASVFFFRAGIFHDFMPQGDRRKNGISIRLGYNYNVRSIHGDLGSVKNEDFRYALLSTKKKTFRGGELLLSLRLRNIRAEASLPMMGYRSGEEVPGLSGTQFATTISFVGGFPLPID